MLFQHAGFITQWKASASFDHWRWHLRCFLRVRSKLLANILPHDGGFRTRLLKKVLYDAGPRIDSPEVHTSDDLLSRRFSEASREEYFTHCKIFERFRSSVVSSI